MPAKAIMENDDEEQVKSKKKIFAHFFPFIYSPWIIASCI